MAKNHGSVTSVNLVSIIVFSPTFIMDFFVILTVLILILRLIQFSGINSIIAIFVDPTMRKVVTLN